ncbi:uncharacterized protein C14orf119 homolog [Thalassophryne amazonica]|uniref:uncharacterized protein C14orf119 homolog n=1 Tax=Thalassophryne amazonica TaxID=390379 RepID=UPI00147126E5|nr:uncharacterized protein C14orf119 homolog [Thalassophryne amazonica]
MSWFGHVSQGSNHQQQQPQNSLYSSQCSRLGGSTELNRTHNWSGCSSPTAEDLPSLPRCSVSLPSLEDLACARESKPISYVTLQEQMCVLSWFQGWNIPQRERFLQDMLGKAVPGKVCTLLESLSGLQVKDRLPNIFECQLRLWTQWFDSWGEDERNHFLHMLEEQDPVFVAHFYRSVAGTAGRD